MGHGLSTVGRVRTERLFGAAASVHIAGRALLLLNVVVKKTGTRQQFDRKKILNGLVRSAEKRPVSIDQLTQIANDVEKKVRSLGENEVASAVIGQYVMEELKDVDEISYIRFASVYRQFKDVGAFMNELETMIKQNKTSADSKTKK